MHPKRLRSRVKEAASNQWSACMDETCTAYLAGAGMDAVTIEEATGHDVSALLDAYTWFDVWDRIPSCAHCTAARELYEWAKTALVADLNLVFGGAA